MTHIGQINLAALEMMIDLVEEVSRPPVRAGGRWRRDNQAWTSDERHLARYAPLKLPSCTYALIGDFYYFYILASRTTRMTRRPPIKDRYPRGASRR